MNNKSIIILFEENEMNIASLYSLYAQNIPEKSEFWEKLSHEEIAHAAQLGNREEKSDDIIESKFARIIIRNVSDFVLEEIKKAQQKKVSHREALKIALRIEQSMLEKKCFELFTPDSKKIQDVFRRLNSDTERHVAALLKEMKKSKLTFADLGK